MSALDNFLNHKPVPPYRPELRIEINSGLLGESNITVESDETLPTIAEARAWVAGGRECVERFVREGFGALNRPDVYLRDNIYDTEGYGVDSDAKDPTP